MQIENIQIESQNLDHLGLVSGMCDEIGLVDAIDNACGQQAKNKHLTYGECVKCMILNGLGFVGRTLYLYSEYFEDKPTDLLIRPSLKYQHIVIFEKGIKVDFSFYPIGVFKDNYRVFFQSHHKVLLDKEAMVLSMPFFNKEVLVAIKPTPDQFLRIINEFWFEAYHVAVYLRRGDLWSAQFRLNGLHH